MHVYVARLVASFVTALVTWLANKFVFFEFLISPENTEAVLALSMATGFAVYGLVHRRLSKVMNPADSAKEPEQAAERMGL
jgi:hypothetical protein